MFKKYRKISNDKRKLIENWGALSFLQLSNYLFPLITLPYIVRILGPEKYGLINFAAAFIGYLVTISDYGFNLSATKEVSVNRSNFDVISNIFSSVIYTKIFLGLLSLVIMIIVVNYFDFFNKYEELYFITFGIVIGNILFPQWFFQGIEKMRYITIINFLVRFGGTIAIFVLIKTQGDFLLLAGINSCVQILVGLIGLIFVIKRFNLKFFFPNVVMIRKQLKNGFDLFKSTIAINLYTNSNIFILGLLTNEQVVGYYSAADKIRIAAQGILGPISQSIFPHVSYLVKESKEKFIRFNRKLLKLQGLLAFMISLLIFLLAGQIGNILLGKEFTESVNVLRILAWLPFVISISNVYGIQTMLPMNFEKEFFKIVGTAALINLFLLFILIPSLKEIGTAISFLISETIVTISMAAFCSKKGIKLFKYEI